MNKIKCVFIFLLLVFNLARCQPNKYPPGLDFELFKATPVYNLARAVEKEDTAAIEKLVSRDPILIDYKEPKFGQTLLFLAVADDKNLSVAKLLKFGANPNDRTLDNSSPFLAACKYLYDLKFPSQMLLLLINHGANVNSIQVDTTNNQFGKRKNDRATPLGLICVYGNLESAKILVEHGADLNSYGENEHAILSTAVLSGKLDIVKYLMIEKKAPIPNYVVIRQDGTQYEKKMTISDLLNENKYKENSQAEKLKLEILAYLSEQGMR